MSLLKTLTVEVVDEGLELYRVCGPRASGPFLDALRSHYELQRPRRGPENRAAVTAPLRDSAHSRCSRFRS